MVNREENYKLLSGNKLISRDHKLLNGNQKVISGGNKLINSNPKLLANNQKVISGGNKFMNGGQKVLATNQKVTKGGNKFMNGGQKVISKPKVLRSKFTLRTAVYLVTMGQGYNPNKLLDSASKFCRVSTMRNYVY
ncbi:MAG: hypothetical protein ACW99Q_03810 [Candidatus Kariarchaeaceae archaeon]|jgi:hypothetical protein